MSVKEEDYSQVWNTDNDRLGCRQKKRKAFSVILFINLSTDVGRNKTKQR